MEAAVELGGAEMGDVVVEVLFKVGKTGEMPLPLAGV